jgi:putative membrane-bound dehydrogenase-like protein
VIRSGFSLGPHISRITFHVSRPAFNVAYSQRTRFANVRFLRVSRTTQISLAVVCLGVAFHKPLFADPPVPAVDTIKYEALPPEKAAQAITLPAGFKATLIASEPDIVQPVAFAIDDRGRLWVAENCTYPTRAPEGQGKDRIVILEDAEGDGRFEKRTVFMEKLNLVCALELGFGGVWVGAAPYLLFIPVDASGDKPAGEPRILLDGFGYQDTHNTLSTFVWGPDGWLYGGHGIACHSKVGRPGTPDKERVKLNGGVWRYHPTKHLFEIFGEGLTNPWGIDFNDYGQSFATGCVRPHLWHIVQGGRYQRLFGEHVFAHTYDDIKQIGDHVHWASGLNPHDANNRSGANGGGHAHSGGMVYLGDSWPAEYRNEIFMFNLHGHRVNMDRLERRGSGCVGRHGPDFLFMNDKWSMVLNLQYGPDGSVYMIDWYDKQTCHNTLPEIHDRSNGRIYRIDYASARPANVNLQRLSSDELMKLQLHSNDWFVRHARRILQERGPEPGVHKKLDAILDDNPDVTRKLRALWALHVTGGLTSPRLLKLMRHENEHVRGWAIQLAFEDKQPSSELLGELNRLAREDNSATVQLYIASALQRLPVKQRIEPVLALARRVNGEDHNLPLMTWFAAEPVVSSDTETATQLIEHSRLAVVREFVARRTFESVDSHGAPSLARGAVVALLDSLDPGAQLDVLRGISAALKSTRSTPSPRGWADFEKKTMGTTNSELRVHTLTLAVKFGSADAPAELKRIAADTRETTEHRRVALGALLAAKDKSLPSVLRQFLLEPSLRSQALRGLAAYDDPSTPEAILKQYDKFDASERREALNSLAGRSAFARQLLRAIETGIVSRRELTAEVVRQLRNLNDTEVNAKLATLWGVARETNADKQKQIEQYAQIWRLGFSQPGDASRGRLLFQRTCEACHTLFNAGGQLGPDLTGANRTSIDYLLQNIVDPSAVIPNEYRGWVVETKDERVLNGVISHENAQSVTLVTSTETLVIPRQEIKTMEQSEGSIMPEELLSALTEQEVRDLLYYLTRPGQVPLPGAAE